MPNSTSATTTIPGVLPALPASLQEFTMQTNPAINGTAVLSPS